MIQDGSGSNDTQLVFGDAIVVIPKGDDDESASDVAHVYHRPYALERDTALPSLVQIDYKSFHRFYQGTVQPFTSSSVKSSFCISCTDIQACGAISLELIQDTDDNFSATDITLYRELLPQLLQRYVVSSDCIISLPANEFPTRKTPLKFRIVKTIPSSRCWMRISKQTRVTVYFNDGAAKKNICTTTTSSSDITTSPPALGGLQPVFDFLCRSILLPFQFVDTDQSYIEFPKGVLLYGPPGVGKTFVVTKVVEHLSSQNVDVKLLLINGPDLLADSTSSGHVESALRQLFAEATSFTSSSENQHHRRKVAIIFMDEMESLCPKREDASVSQSRIVATLLVLLDGLTDRSTGLFIIGATNLPNSIDSAIRRPGRLDREFFLEPPNVDDREMILNSLLKTSSDLCRSIAVKTIGYVGADLSALVREASLIALEEKQSILKPCDTLSCVASVEVLLRIASVGCRLQNYFEFSSKPFLLRGIRRKTKPTSFSFLQVEEWHFDAAMKKVGASSLRTHHNDSSTKPTTGWDSIGGQEDAKYRLQQAVEWPLKYGSSFKRLGIQPPRGFLCYGPPGTGKTHLVRATACAAGASFFSCSGADIYSPYVGDAEAAIRKVFRQARAATPAIIFFDEIDGLVSSRSFSTSKTDNSSSSSTEVRVLATLLNEMDGMTSSEGLLVIGATNRPEAIDAALLRPGRFDRLLYIDLPNAEDRIKILKIYAAKMQLGPCVNFQHIAELTCNYSGAELQNLCREAALDALRSISKKGSTALNAKRVCVTMDNFKSVLLR